jgi:hypothetical protein
MPYRSGSSSATVWTGRQAADAIGDDDESGTRECGVLVV